MPLLLLLDLSIPLNLAPPGRVCVPLFSNFKKLFCLLWCNFDVVRGRCEEDVRGRRTKINSALKILLVKTYGNTFFIEGKLWLFRWKCLIARWKEGTLSYTCVSLFGAEMTENNYYRTSNTSKNQKNGIEWHVWASNKWCFGALGTIQRHTCVAESTFFPTRYQTLSTKESKFSYVFTNDILGAELKFSGRNPAVVAIK